MKWENILNNKIIAQFNYWKFTILRFNGRFFENLKEFNLNQV